MREFGKVSPRFWVQGSGKRLRGDSDAQLLALHLLSGPSSTMIGLYYLPLPTVAHELGWDIKRVQLVLDRVSGSGFCAYDTQKELVWVFNAAEIEFGDGKRLGPKREKGIARQLEPFGNHPFVRDFLHRYGTRYHIIVAGLAAEPLDAKQMALGYPINTVSGFGHQGQGQVLTGAGDLGPPPPQPKTVAEARAAYVVRTEDAKALYLHWRLEHEAEHGNPMPLIEPPAALEGAKHLLAYCGGDVALAKSVISAYVRHDRDFWRRENWALSLLGDSKDFERALNLVPSNGRAKHTEGPRSTVPSAEETAREQARFWNELEQERAAERAAKGGTDAPA